MNTLPSKNVPPVTPEQQFIALLPEVAYRIAGLLDGPHGRWQYTHDQCDGVLGLAHALAADGNMAGIVTVSNWLGRDPASGEVVAKYGMRLQGSGPLVSWMSDASAPNEVHFNRQTGRRGPQRSNFEVAHQLADLLRSAEPVDIDVYARPRVAAAVGRFLRQGMDSFGEIIYKGYWPRNF